MLVMCLTARGAMTRCAAIGRLESPSPSAEDVPLARDEFVIGLPCRLRPARRDTIAGAGQSTAYARFPSKARCVSWNGAVTSKMTGSKGNPGRL
jgi:hypothetical protein